MPSPSSGLLRRADVERATDDIATVRFVVEVSAVPATEFDVVSDFIHRVWREALANPDILCPQVIDQIVRKVSAALENWTVSAVKSEHSTIGE